MPSFAVSYRARTNGRKFWQKLVNGLKGNGSVKDLEGWFDTRRAHGILHGRWNDQRFQVVYRVGGGDILVLLADDDVATSTRISKDGVESLAAVLAQVAQTPKSRSANPYCRRLWNRERAGRTTIAGLSTESHADSEPAAKLDLSTSND